MLPSTRSLLASLVAAAACASILLVDVAHADEATPAERKGDYALPFAMRPALAANLVRLDDALALTDASKTKGATTHASLLTAGYRPVEAVPDLGLYARVALVHFSNDAGVAATALSNPLVFGLFTPELAPHLRLALFLGATAPIGAGGGDAPASSTVSAVQSGVYARQAMDNALFASNFLSVCTGAGLAWIDRGFTAQAELGVFELVRARGAGVEADASRTNFTGALGVGYRIVPLLTASVELHYQRWLSTPMAVEKDATKRAQATYGLGLRANLPLSRTTIARPGLGYFRGIDDPMATARYQIVQLDLPIAF